VENRVAKRRILIADDEARVLLVLHESLKRLGDAYEISVAHSGQEALHLALDRPFDLIITDLRMPGMGGVELARAVKASAPGTDFIWITAYGCHNVAEECDQLGILVCLDKPLEIREIRRTVREALDDRDQGASARRGTNSYLQRRNRS
jgi:DNA-binding NtrC family response regulator